MSELDIAQRVQLRGIGGTFPELSRTSFSDLAIRQYGFQARGASVKFQDLLSLRIPVIRKLTAHQFKEIWELSEDGKGKILIIVPEDRQQQVNSAFFGEPAVNSSMLALISRLSPMLGLDQLNLVY